MALGWRLLLSAAVGTAAFGSQPNVVVIVADDLGWTQTSVQMHPDMPEAKSDYHLTPNLERLANEGMRFSSAYAASPMCSPSRTAIMTGKSPGQLHQTDVLDSLFLGAGQYQTYYQGRPTTPPLGFPILDEEVSIAERLGTHAPDYATALLRKSHMGPNPETFGFDLYDFHQFGYEVPGEDPYKLFSTANHANQYMQEQVAAEQPFFMTIATTAIHAPLEWRSDSFDMFAALPRGQRHKVPAVAAAVYDMDASIGQVLDQLDALGIADDTYVFFTSDNGGTTVPQNNYPLYDAKGSLWEGGIRVPFIARGPGIAANSFSDVPVYGPDLYATISDLAGISAALPEGTESASLVPVLQNGGVLPAGTNLERAYGPEGELFWHFPHYTPSTTPVSAIRDGDFKLLKFYGSNGADDTLFLFNLAENVGESGHPASSLNLVDEMPAKTTALLAKLDGWLDAIDASMPHNTTDDVHLQWRASDPGEHPAQWRSVHRVQDFRRESWDIDSNFREPYAHQSHELAEQVEIRPFQPGLGTHAFEFDGDDLLARQYFQVSDPTSPQQSGDYSATVDFWLKIDDLEEGGPQVVFETGGEVAGMSVTLGNADNDGLFNDVRFRVLGSSGDALTATAAVDDVLDPERDFVHVAAVFSDDDADRYVALYVNGLEVARSDGLPGSENRINWDNLDAAGLGGVVGAGLGGNRGAGALPFDGSFTGQIAEMGFYNHAIDDDAVQAKYNAFMTPVDLGMATLNGAETPLVRPVALDQGVVESPQMQVFHERTAWLLDPLPVDALVDGSLELLGGPDATPGALTAGQLIHSYLLQFDPPGETGGLDQTLAGSIEFEEEILGILFDPGTLAGTDVLLGSVASYGSSANRGLMLSPDRSLSVSADGRQLSFDWTVDGDELVQIRVLTSALLADLNLDGLVDSLDLDRWEANFGRGILGDADRNGQTAGSDFLWWQRGRRDELTPTPATVPEPAGAILALLVIAIRVVHHGRCERARH